MATTVYCNNCGELLDEASDSTERRPCPNCQSLARRIDVVIGLSGSGTLSVGAPLAPAPTMKAESTLTMSGSSVSSGSLDTTTEVHTAIGQATHHCEVRLSPLDAEANSWWAEVVHKGVVVAQAPGLTRLEALCGVITCMLPPDDPAYGVAPEGDS